MSRIFDALQRADDEITSTIVSALDDGGEIQVAPELDTHTLITSTLQNLPSIPASDGHSLPLAINVSPVRQVSTLRSAPMITENHSQSVSSRLADIRTAALKVTGHSPLLPFDTANWRASEQYRTIRTRILQDARQPRTIAVSSAGSGDGKSVTAINIAGALSLKAEADVILIDADFRRSSVHSQLSVPLSPGLTDILMNQCTLEDALVRAEQFPNFYILPAGRRVENPSDLLETSRWITLREQISRLFHFSILDCPPVGAVSEWDLLQSACDGVLFVGRQDHTKLEELVKALESIPGQKLIGVIMNCVSDWFLAHPHNSYDYPRPPVITT